MLPYPALLSKMRRSLIRVQFTRYNKGKKIKSCNDKNKEVSSFFKKA